MRARASPENLRSKVNVHSVHRLMGQMVLL